MTPTVLTEPPEGRPEDPRRLDIVTVSAHYPPNFVSGGSLVPRTLARGLAARGHSSRVFAGWYEPDPDGADTPATWTEPDGHGVEVTWVNTTPWLAWSDRRNFENPAVTEMFSDYIADARPDLVHFHSLQGLGVGPIDVAADAAIPVVVTMHDFWWTCARQFLVDPAGEPCCVVSSAGSCPCESGFAAAEERRDRLSRTLRRVDLVLAPSNAACRVFRANGLTGKRLEVAENAVGDDLSRLSGLRRQTPSDRTIVRYTGGANTLKGIDVLLDAAGQVSTRKDWTLVAHGIEGTHGGGPLPPHVETADGYAPSELDSVLEHTDLLVVPSVMRESHSIVTREALSSGVPVVASDCIGPEEVIVHGHNGFVVPTGDAESLAAVLTDLIDDPSRLAELGAAARTVTSVTLPEHLDQLESFYGDLLRDEAGDVAGDGASTERPVRVSRLLFVVGIEGAPLRYRVRLPSEALAMLGVASDVLHYRDPAVARLADGADAVIYYRVPATTQVVGQIEEMKAAGTPVLFDVDDLIFDPDLAAEVPAMSLLPAEEAELWMRGVRRYRTTLQRCDAFVGSTPMLAEHARDVTGLPSFVFANGVGRVLGRHSDDALRRVRLPGPLRIGYFSGTTTHDDDWAAIEPAVIATLQAHSEVELWIGGTLNTTGALEPFAERVTRLEMVPWTKLPFLIRDIDINLAPLELGGRFNEAKSSIKWLEAALVETPTIASASGPFAADIESGRNGYLASSEAEWIAALEALVSSGAARAQMGGAARRSALLEYSPLLQGRRYLEIIDTVRENVERWRLEGPTAEWVDVLDDEPPESHALEAYDEHVSDAADVVDAGRPESLERSSAQRVIDRVNAAVPRDGWGQRFRLVAEKVITSIRRRTSRGSAHGS